MTGLPPINGFREKDDSLLGLLISHPHLDHYGLLKDVRPETPVFIGSAARSILEAASLFSPSGFKIKSAGTLVDRRPITIGPFIVTPFLMDHSAYDTYGILVEAEGRRLFYTADFRGHGRKRRLFDLFVEKPPSGIDVLVTEGTRVGLMDAYNQSEDDLVPEFESVISKTKGMVLTWASGQNIDRIVTIYKACLKTRRQLIVDLYTAEILKAIGNPRLPQAGWKNIKVFLPFNQKRLVVRQRLFDLAAAYRKQRIYSEGLKDESAQSVMLFRPSMFRDLEKADCLTDASLICSVWGGYLSDAKNQWLVTALENKGIPFFKVHSSGHASLSDLGRMQAAFPDAKIVPIHLNKPDAFSESFPRAVFHNDGEWWSV